MAWWVLCWLQGVPVVVGCGSLAGLALGVSALYLPVYSWPPEAGPEIPLRVVHAMVPVMGYLCQPCPDVPSLLEHLPIRHHDFVHHSQIWPDQGV